MILAPFYPGADNFSAQFRSGTLFMNCHLGAETCTADGNSLALPAHSDVPSTPVLSFDNADQQSLIISERPNLIGDPYSGVCPNGTRVGTPACWFNPSAFALPPPGQFGTAGRNSLKGPNFTRCFSSKMGKCIQMIHFLNIRGISLKYQQANTLITEPDNKICLAALTSLHSLILPG
jgi:hypothetical protein